MNIPTINIAAILPSVVLSVCGIIVMVAEPFVQRHKRSQLGWFAFAGVLVAGLSIQAMAASPGQWYSNLWIVDQYSIYFHAVFLLIAGLTILISMNFLEREN